MADYAFAAMVGCVTATVWLLYCGVEWVAARLIERHRRRKRARLERDFDRAIAEVHGDGA